MLGVDDFGEGGTVRFFADVGGLVPVELGVADALASFRHFHQAEVDAVGENRG